MTDCSTTPGNPAFLVENTRTVISETPVPLNVVITSPFVWPWVRRGSERMLHDFSCFLASRGHRITVFSTGPEDAIEDRNGITYHLLKQRFSNGPRQFNSCHYFAFRLQRVLGCVEPDVVFSMNYFDAYAAIRARQRNGAGYSIIFHSAGILSRRHFLAAPLDAWFFRTVRRHVNATLAVSRSAGKKFKHDFGNDPVILPPPVVIENFSPIDSGTGPQPLTGRCIIFVGDADDRRKGARTLCRAFPLVMERCPDARLLFAGKASETTRQNLFSEAARYGTAEYITFLGVGKIEDLPALYQSASVTVLPSVAEAFGMVLVESLAAGTPVVGTRHGGITEIIDEDLVGRLFEPGEFTGQTNNFRGLADAIVEVLTRGKPPAVVAACQARARQYSWETLGPEYERILHQVVLAGNDTSLKNLNNSKR